MSFILQRKDNECAVVSLMYLLRSNNIDCFYNEIKFKLQGNYSFQQIKFVAKLQGISLLGLNVESKEISNVIFTRAILQIKTNIGLHFVYAERNGLDIKFKNYNKFFIKNPLKYWTGYILVQI